MSAATRPPPTVALPDGETRPALGLGTWRTGEDASRAAAEERAFRTALEIGWRVVDTAEMYGDGGAETVLGRALAPALRQGLPRDELFVVSKVYPHHAGESDVVAACERSLRRLQLDRIDLYLLHWRGSVPLAETVRGFEALRARGLIRHWGVSNFDVDDLDELDAAPGGDGCAANQVYFSPSERGPEFALLPAQRRRGMPLMAYSPIDQGALAADPALAAAARARGVAPAQLALAWVLHHDGVMALPKSTDERHLRQNWDARTIALTDAERAAIDRRFPPPRRKRPLAMI